MFPSTTAAAFARNACNRTCRDTESSQVVQLPLLGWITRTGQSWYHVVCNHTDHCLFSSKIENHRHQNPASPKPTRSSLVETLNQRHSILLFNFVRIVGCKPYFGPLGQVEQRTRDSAHEHIHQISPNQMAGGL